jgi:DNA-binding MarR family transcriptional regulator
MIGLGLCQLLEPLPTPFFTSLHPGKKLWTKPWNKLIADRCGFRYSVVGFSYCGVLYLFHQQAQRVGGQAMNKEDQVIMNFRDLFNKMVWLNKFKMEDSLKGYKPSEVHCIEYIGRNADPNVTKLAEAFYMTSGAISKITKKLINRGIIESYQKPDNKKEIYFKLTEQGKVIYNIHEELHREFQERDKPVFEQVTEEQFDSMLSFIEKYSRHLDAQIKKQSVEMKPD